MNIQDAIARMEFSCGVADDDLVSGVVVLVHVVHADTGGEALVIANSDGMGAFTQTGIVAEAWRIVNSGDDEGEA